MLDSNSAGVSSIGTTSSVSAESEAICGVTLSVRAPVRTIAGSLFSVSSRGAATVTTFPCTASRSSSLAASVTRSAVSARRGGAARSPGALAGAAAAAQSIPGAFSSVSSTSTTRASIWTWRCTRSCTASRYVDTRSSRSGKSVTCSSPDLRSTLNAARSESSVLTPAASSSNTSLFDADDTLAALFPFSAPTVVDAMRCAAT